MADCEQIPRLLITTGRRNTKLKPSEPQRRTELGVYMNQAECEATYRRLILAVDPPTRVVRSKQMRGAWMQLRAVPALDGGSLVSAAWADDLRARRASRQEQQRRRSGPSNPFKQ